MRGVGAEKLLRVKDVAERLTISTRQVWRMVAEGDLPQPMKVGCSARWLESWVEAYIERQLERRAQ